MKVHTFPNGTRFFQLRSTLLACEDCDIRVEPRRGERSVFVFDGREVRKLPGFLSDQRVTEALGQSVNELVRPAEGGEYRFYGELPEAFLEVYGQYDDDESAGNGQFLVSEVLERGEDGWQRSGREGIREKNDPLSKQPNPIALPRAFDDAVLEAPLLPSWDDRAAALAGGGGPLLLIRERRLAHYDGKAWRESELDEPMDAARRLSDGRSLVQTSGGLFVVGRDGQVKRYVTPDEASGRDLAWFVVADRPVFVSNGVLYRLSDANIRIIRPEPREPLPKPAPINAAPSASPDAGTAAAEAGDGAGRIVLGSFTPACSTPFVVLFNPPSRPWRYQDVAKSLAGRGELQAHLTFAELTTGDVNYFGAQADSEEHARALMQAYVEKVPRGKPMLACLDIRRHVPDRYAPEPNARIVLINLRAGGLL